MHATSCHIEIMQPQGVTIATELASSIAKTARDDPNDVCCQLANCSAAEHAHAIELQHLKVMSQMMYSCKRANCSPAERAHASQLQPTCILEPDGVWLQACQQLPC